MVPYDTGLACAKGGLGTQPASVPDVHSEQASFGKAVTEPWMSVTELREGRSTRGFLGPHSRPTEPTPLRGVLEA